jgi:hypothetical protein
MVPPWLFSAESDTRVKFGGHSFWGVLPPPTVLIHYVCCCIGTKRRQIGMRLLGRWFGPDVEWATRPGGSRTEGVRTEAAVAEAAATPQHLQGLPSRRRGMTAHDSSHRRLPNLAASDSSHRLLIGFAAPLPLSHLRAFARPSGGGRSAEDETLLLQKLVLRAWSTFLARAALHARRLAVMPLFECVGQLDVFSRFAWALPIVGNASAPLVCRGDDPKCPNGRRLHGRRLGLIERVKAARGGGADGRGARRNVGIAGSSGSSGSSGARRNVGIAGSSGSSGSSGARRNVGIAHPSGRTRGARNGAGVRAHNGAQMKGAACMPRLDGECFETLGYPEELATAAPEETERVRLPEALTKALVLEESDGRSRGREEMLKRGLAELLQRVRNASARVLLLEVDDVARRLPSSASSLLQSADLKLGLDLSARRLELHTCADFVRAPRDGSGRPFSC